MDILPPKLDRCVKKLMQEGHTEQEAWAICRKSLGYVNMIERLHQQKISTGLKIDNEFLEQETSRLRKEYDINSEPYDIAIQVIKETKEEK